MTANREMAAMWNDASGRTWVELQSVLDASIASFVPLIVDAAFPGEGGGVLDVGCGAGATTLAMARRVGSAGACVGADISAPLVEAARKRAAAEGVPNVRYVEADAQTYPFDAATFDAVISRFGVMFFDDPPAAFANIHRATRPGAKLAFAAWRGPRENPFMTAPARAAGSLFPELKPPDPDAPGMFAFADGDKVRRILEASGWGDIDVQPVDVPCTVAAEHLPTYATRLGALAPHLRTADDATRARAIELATGAYQPFVRDGAAHFTAACWFVRAVA
jgi:SAM-dependent methyltransferase